MSWERPIKIVYPVNEWEVFWNEYINALDNYDADWSGEEFVIDFAKVANQLKEAKDKLRSLDAEFCKGLII